MKRIVLKCLKIGGGFFAFIALSAAAFVYLTATGLFGTTEGPGTITQASQPQQSVAARAARQTGLGPNSQDGQILFGDFHVHTTISADAFMMSLPMLGGEGSHPQADACDFARFCSALDFWSINDHAEDISPKRWQDTIQSIRHCNAVAGTDTAPDTVAFLGWEWTQMGTNPSNHYGHRNVILSGLADHDIPIRPIGARPPPTMGADYAALPKALRGSLPLISPTKRSFDAGTYYAELENAQQNKCADHVPVRDLPADCMESAATPTDLLAKLSEWGMDLMVIPHGTSWGNYTPPLSSWQKQLNSGDHNPAIQNLVEIYSGHGSAEEYRPWRAANRAPDGSLSCPPPSDSYLPSCWRAGQIIEERCRAEGKDATDCATRAALTRQAHVERGNAGHLVVPGASVEEWLDAGQCTDCFLPAFNYRPMGSAQYMLALTNFDDADKPLQFRFGFIGSSDNHKARPGTGFKELDRREMTEATGFKKGPLSMAPSGPKPSQPDLVDTASFNAVDSAERARISSFFTTGGLIAVHAENRQRDAIWSAVTARHVYGTSGDRILLWFNLTNPDNGAALAMGRETQMTRNPVFEVTAAGAFEQKPGCPNFTKSALGAERLYSLCRDECYNPSETRKAIERIEIVKITPQIHKSEAVGQLIQDPWLTHDCAPDELGCAFTFSDPDFVSGDRTSVYYARAIQAPSDAVNGNNLRCTYDAEGNCVAVNPCHADENDTDYQDDCLAPVNERAWSSPIWIDPR